MTNLPGADLNAACSGPNGARLMDEPSNERSQRTCNLKYDGYIQINMPLDINMSAEWHRVIYSIFNEYQFTILCIQERM
ncbi:hypothetical protein EGD00_14500 [Pectobacterium carotovorum subsp. carotovorum]|nr:hypothetical protein EGD00_14500 [Pectobacterium carotovorum subsp. carotovorum]